MNIKDLVWYCTDVKNNSGTIYYELTSKLCGKTEFSRREVLQGLMQGYLNVQNLSLSKGENPRILYKQIDTSNIKVHENIDTGYIAVADRELITHINTAALNISKNDKTFKFKGLKFIITDAGLMKNKFKMLGKYCVSIMDDIIAYPSDSETLTVASKLPIRMQNWNTNGSFSGTGFNGLSKQNMNIDISNLDFGDTDFCKYFCCYSEDAINNRGKFNNIKITNKEIKCYHMSNTFTGATINNLIIDSISSDTLSVISPLFHHCDIENLLISNINMPKLLCITRLFDTCSISNLMLNNINIPNIRNLTYVFVNCTIDNIKASNINASNDIENLSSFAENSKFESGILDLRWLNNSSGKLKSIERMLYKTVAKEVLIDNINLATIKNTKDAFSTFSCFKISNNALDKIVKVNDNIDAKVIKKCNTNKTILITAAVMKKIHNACLDVDPTMKVNEYMLYNLIENGGYNQKIANYIRFLMDKQIEIKTNEWVVNCNSILSSIEHMSDICSEVGFKIGDVTYTSYWNISFCQVRSITEIKKKLENNKAVCIKNIATGLYVCLNKATHTCKVISEFTMKIKATNVGIFNGLRVNSIDISNLSIDASNNDKLSEPYYIDSIFDFHPLYISQAPVIGEFKIGNFDFSGMSPVALDALLKKISTAKIGIINLEGSRFSIDTNNNADIVHEYYYMSLNTVEKVMGTGNVLRDRLRINISYLPNSTIASSTYTQGVVPSHDYDMVRKAIYDLKQRGYQFEDFVILPNKTGKYQKITKYPLLLFGFISKECRGDIDQRIMNNMDTIKSFV